MPGWATRRSSSWVAGRASLAVARNRSSPAAQALTMASRCGGTPVEVSQCTRVTTARAMCLAMPACLRSSSSIRPCGSRGATRAVLDLGATFAIGPDYTSGYRYGHRVDLLAAVSLDEVEHPAPRVVAGVLPLGETAVEEAVRRVLVNVRLDRDAGGLELPHELLRLLQGRSRIRAGDHHQQRRLQLGNEALAPHRPPVEPDASVQVRVKSGLIPGARSAKAEADREQRFHRAA